jgi:rod shape-determining protein MreC
VLDRLLRWKIPLIIVLVLILVGTIHNTSVPRPDISRLEGLWRDVLSPFQWLFSRIAGFFQNQFAEINRWRGLKARNNELEARVAQLEEEVLRLRNYRRENEWLREALDFREEGNHDLLVAEVIGRSPSNWESTIIVNKGQAHGVTSGMAVVTQAGVVGTIINSSRHTSTVLLIVDAQSATGGLVQSTGDLVLVEGGQMGQRTLLAKPLSRDTVVEVGDVIVTSGLSRIYPKNLPIGEVVAVEPRQYDLSFAAIVEPFVDFTRLEYVLIVMPQEES